MTSWKFQENNSGEFQGVQSGQSVIFKKNVFGGLGKEMLQNSMDAKRDGQTKVILSFKLNEVDRKDIPGIISFKERLEACKEIDYESNDSSRDWYNVAFENINKDKIQILEIHDQNTTGMAGPCEPGTGFYAFTKANGLSEKTDGSGGSWGWGKNSIFNVSTLRKFFVSTKYRDDNDNEVSLAIGKTILATHKLGEKSFDNSGYYGIESKDKTQGTIPFEGDEEIKKHASWLLRRDIGTSIFTIGFKNQPDWEKKLIGTLIKTNFPAIYNEEAAIKIENNISGTNLDLNKGTLTKLMNDNSIKEALKDAADRQTEPDPFYMTAQYMTCMHKDATEKNIQDPQLGHFSLRIVVNDQFKGKNVCLIRNGMVIADGVGDKKFPGLAMFPKCRNFAAIIEPKNKIGNDAIKSLEGPAHDGIDYDHIDDLEKRRKAEKNISRMAKKIRRHINEVAAFEEGNSTTMGFTNIFSIEGNDGDESGQRDPEGKLIWSLKPMRTKIKPIQYKPGGEGDEGHNGSGTGNGNGNGNGQGENGNHGSEGTGDNKYLITREIIDVRVIWISKDTIKIFFGMREELENFELRIQAIGERQNDFVSIYCKGSSKGKISDSGHVTDLSINDERLELEVKLEDASKFYSKALSIFAVSYEEENL